jgi:tetratricopeptide (TPR) repeat protein
MREHPKVFCSHRSVDKPRVKEIAARLRSAGIDAWVDEWEIALGDDLVAKINQGLAEYDVGLLFLSKASMGSGWVTAEVSTLIHQMIVEGRSVIPVMLELDAPVPPLLKPRARVGFEQVEALIDAIYGRGANKPPLGTARVQARERSLRITLRRGEGGSLFVAAMLDGKPIAPEQEVALGADFAFSYRDFLDNRVFAARKDSEGTERDGWAQALAKLGDALGRALFPAAIAPSVQTLLDEAAAKNEAVVLSFETADRDLLAIPFEAARLPDGRIPALEAGVRALRRFMGHAGVAAEPLPGPLRILVAVGAPDEGKTPNSVLDVERELQALLDAVAEARRYGNAEVEILEVGHPDEIQKALEAQSFHVLHLSGHGGAGRIELETEDGEPFQTDAARLAQAFRSAERPLPLVFLASCLTGAGGEETASLAQGLLEQGVPMVLAMQSSVSDEYATRLAGSFYEHLSHLERPLPSHALELARQEVEKERREAIARGEKDPRRTTPEYATPSLFCAGEEIPLLDRGVPQVESRRPPRAVSTGPVPLLEIGDLIGRRPELRETLRVLRDDERSLAVRGRKAGIVLHGIGGLGKSALAGRAMSRLAEEGWKLAAVAGRWSLGELATRAGGALLTDDDEEVVKIARLLFDGSLPDEARLSLLQQLIGAHRVLLVLDNFEDNLTLGGGSFLDETTAWVLGALLEAAREGKILLTCRYPVAGVEERLHAIHLPPLSPAQTRKLFYRLAGLKEQPPEALERVLRLVGGHPRVLEYLDALLRKGVGRVPDVERRLRENLAKRGLRAEDLKPELDSALLDAVRVAAQDVLLDELLVLVGKTPGDRDVLDQIAVFPVGVELREVAYALAEGKVSGEEGVEGMEKAVSRLAALSLVAPLGEDQVFVHRWSAGALKEPSRIEPERLRELRRRAGEALIWPVRERTHLLEDAVEGARLLLAAGDLERARKETGSILHFMKDHGQALGVVAFCQEAIHHFPEDHEARPGFLQMQGDSLISVGLTAKAETVYLEALRETEALANGAPKKADYKRWLAVLYDRLGNLYRGLGKGETARELAEKALEVIEALARAEPNRADYQRDLSVSYNKLGDLHRDLGNGQAAREHFEKSLAIAEKLARAEPSRADYQRDLSVSYDKLGDLLRALGNGQAAQELYEKGLAIAEKLARAEPNRADYQRDLSVSYSRLGNLHRDLGNGQAAQEYYEKDLAIAEKLARAEPNRADYQADLVVSLIRAAESGAEPRAHLERALAIVTALEARGALTHQQKGWRATIEGLLASSGSQPPAAT